MKHYRLFIALTLLPVFICTGCGNSKNHSDNVSAQSSSADSAVCRIALIPTFDCLPFYVADATNLFQAVGADVKVVSYGSQLDADTALLHNRVEVGLTDICRADWLKSKGASLKTLFSVNSSWQLIANASSRINKTSQLGDKIVAITSHSALDQLFRDALSGQRLSGSAYPVQVNDLFVRRQMLFNKSVDAAFLTEPYATVARSIGHVVIYDSRQFHRDLGVVVANSRYLSSAKNKANIDLIVKAYNMACDSINTRGYVHYTQLLQSRFNISKAHIDSLSKPDFKKANIHH